MSMRAMHTVFVIVIFLYATGCSKLPKQSHDFGDVSEEMTSMAVMPPSFAVQEVASFSEQVLSAMNHDIEVEIGDCVESLIAESRIDLASLKIDDAVLAGDPELRTSLFEQADAVRDARLIIIESGKTIDVSYDADVDYFADMSGTDFLMFVEGNGWFKTGGALVKGAMLAQIFGGTQSYSNTTLSAFIVDAARGKVVWYNEVSIENRDPRKPNHLMKSCQKLLKPLLGKSSIDADDSREDEIIDRYKDEMQEEG